MAEHSPSNQKHENVLPKHALIVGADILLIEQRHWHSLESCKIQFGS